MLATIVLFLALVSLGFTIIKYRLAIFEAKSKIELDLFFISVTVTAALFSLFYYLIH